MRDRPSFTAAWVALCRTLGGKLPVEARLVDDPYGASFAGAGAALVSEHFSWIALRYLRRFALFMQVRTRVIDDVLREFLSSGGTQVLLLGAGYDCRALRLAHELRSTRVFEVDHPATQAYKRRVLERRGLRAKAVTYLAWDFEARPMDELPAALSALGHDGTRPTLTVWEGVTMYLTEPAIESSLGAVRALAPADSPLVMTYFDRTRVVRPKMRHSLIGTLAARAGEPFRFGWSPSEFPPWASARGFDVAWDKNVIDLARELLPEAQAGAIRERLTRIALLHRAA